MKNLNEKNMDIMDWLMENISGNDIESIKEILKDTEDINNLVDSHGMNILMGYLLLESYEIDVVKLIVDQGINVNHQDKKGWNALHIASRDGMHDVIEILVKNGSEVNAIESFGNTPLARLLNKTPVDYRSVKLLVEHGADPTIKNKYGNSPKDTAILMGEKKVLEMFDL